MINCPNCGRENEDEYKYCLGCGTVLPRPEVKAEPVTVGCSNCGANIPPNFKFCGECGTPVASQPTVEERRHLAEPAPTASRTEPSPAPKPASEPVSKHLGDLVVIKPDGTEGAKIPISEGEVKLGRDSDYEVLASDPFLSPHHASLFSDDSSHLLKDVDSLNGVFIRITNEVELQDGDFIRVGQELMQFRELSDVLPIIPRASDEKTLTDGSPDAGYWGRLSLISGPETETRAFVFSQDEITLGREVGDILFRDDGFVSGRHARLAKIDGRVVLKDLGSSNGTYIRIRGEREIGAGDLILMGQQLFRVEL